MNKIIAIGAGAMVAILIIMVGMVPLTAEIADDIHSTGSNKDIVRYSIAETHNRVTVELRDGIGYINNKPIKENFAYREMMFSDTFILQYDPGTEPNAVLRLLYISNSVGTTYNLNDIVAHAGTWTAHTTTNETVTGSYNWIMAWNPNGDYGALISGQVNTPVYLNADDDVFVCGAASSNLFSLQRGTIGNLETVLIIGDPPTVDITTEQYTEEPDVLKLTAFNGSTAPSAIYVPIKYDIITPTDEIIKTIINLMPLFTGIILFAAMGISMMRLTRSD